MPDTDAHSSNATNSQRARFYELGEFQLDVDRGVLTRKSGEGAPTTLTPRVLATLLCLLERAGELVEKETLMRVVWQRVVVEENNLEQNISTLRHILGERRGENRYVETSRGRGYRFVAPALARASTD